MVKDGCVKVFIVIGCDYLDVGSVVSFYCEMEVMKDGLDVVLDWLLLNFGVGIVLGVLWMSFYYGGGVGLGFLQYFGLVIVVDGIDEVVKKLSWVLINDFGMGVICYVDVGYDYVLDVVCECGIDLLSLGIKDYV